jgi:4-amino-4-deoxy-L-arabinose transferase-like glycosyltransferase
MGALTAFAVFYLSKEVAGDGGGVLSVVALLAIPKFTAYSRMAMLDVYACAFSILCSAYLYSRVKRGNVALRHIVIASALMGFALGSKMQGSSFATLIALVLWLTFTVKSDAKKRLQLGPLLLLLSIVFFILFNPVYLYTPKATLFKLLITMLSRSTSHTITGYNWTPFLSMFDANWSFSWPRVDTIINISLFFVGALALCYTMTRKENRPIDLLLALGLTFNTTIPFLFSEWYRPLIRVAPWEAVILVYTLYFIKKTKLHKRVKIAAVSVLLSLETLNLISVILYYPTYALASSDALHRLLRRLYLNGFFFSIPAEIPGIVLETAGYIAMIACVLTASILIVVGAIKFIHRFKVRKL